MKGVDGLAETEAKARITGNDGRSIEITHDINSIGVLAFREQRIKAKAQALLGEDLPSILWNAVQAADLTTFGEWLEG